MIRTAATLATLGLIGLAASTSLAQEGAPKAGPACAAMDASLPPALSGWNGRSDLAAAATAEATGKASLPIGKGVNAQLKRTPEVIFPVLPEKPGGSVSYSGLYEINVSEAGNYQVSLGSGAWIDVASGRAFIDAGAHAPGPACSTLKKTVIFPLKPGKYVLEIAGNGEAVLPVMVTKAAS
jgi:hypothetical protein